MDVGTHPLNLAVWGESWGSAQDQRGPRGARRQGAVTVPARDSGSLPQAPHVPLCFFCKNDECSFRSPECLLPHPPRMFLVPKALLGLRSPGTRRLCHPPTHSPFHSPVPVSSAIRCFPPLPARFSLAGMVCVDSWLSQSVQEAGDPELFKGRLVEYPRGGRCHSVLHPTSPAWLFLTGSARQSSLLGLPCPEDRGRLSSGYRDKAALCPRTL